METDICKGTRRGERQAKGRQILLSNLHVILCDLHCIQSIHFYPFSYSLRIKYMTLALQAPYTLMFQLQECRNSSSEFCMEKYFCVSKILSKTCIAKLFGELFGCQPTHLTIFHFGSTSPEIHHLHLQPWRVWSDIKN